MPDPRKALYPGTFDVLTNGHVDLIRRTAGLFTELVVAVARNDSKNPTFSAGERVAILREACAEFPNVSVGEFDILTTDYAIEIGAGVIVRGLRFVSDFEYELQMALMNRSMAPEIETLFLAPSAEFSFLSSRFVREIARRGGDVSAYVPAAVARVLVSRFPSPA
jgi:pantetheine-phosphate adenylyltransferase